MFEHAWQERYAHYLGSSEDSAEEGDFETNQAKVFSAGFTEGVLYSQKSIDDCKISLIETKRLLSKYVKEFEQSLEQLQQNTKEHKKDYDTLRVLFTLFLLLR